jgi:NTP pyrophosphatase (non-canonical NTP hydrolase)
MNFQEAFQKVEKICLEYKHRIKNEDILYGLTEELGEYSRACRVEDKAPICGNKTIKESSKVEIVDLMLICIEAYISRGGTYEEIDEIMEVKLNKWEELWRNEK